MADSNVPTVLRPSSVPVGEGNEDVAILHGLEAHVPTIPGAALWGRLLIDPYLEHVLTEDFKLFDLGLQLPTYFRQRLAGGACRELVVAAARDHDAELGQLRHA